MIINEIYVDLPAKNINGYIEIIDSEGKIVIRKEITAQKMPWLIHTCELPAGSYILRATTSEGEKTGKIIKL